MFFDESQQPLSAGQAESQMDPAVSDRQTLLATLWSARTDGVDLVQMATNHCAQRLFS